MNEDEKDGERKLEDFRDRGDAIARECNAQILTNSSGEHLVRLEHWPRVLQDDEQELERQHFVPVLVGPSR